MQPHPSAISMVKKLAETALANNDVVMAIEAVEWVQKGYYAGRRYPEELEQHALRVARFLLLARYGKLSAPRLAPTLRTGSSITFTNSLRQRQGLPVRRQQWR